VEKSMGSDLPEKFLFGALFVVSACGALPDEVPNFLDIFPPSD